MAFWSTTTLDPKRQFKFKVQFSALGADATFLAQSADRPVYTISDTTKVDFLDKSYYYPGKITWNTVKIKFVDANGTNSNVAQRAYTFLGASGWTNPTDVTPNESSATSFGTINKAAAVNEANTVAVSVLDSTGTTVDKWQLKNAFVTTVALNNLDYAAEGILTAEFTFRYDWADYSAGA